MNKKFRLVLNLVCLAFLFTNLKCDPIIDGDPESHTVKILITDAIVSEKDEDGKNRVPEDLQKLCEILVSEQEDCNKITILEPTLRRVDTEEELSLKTALKSFSADTKNVKVIQKLIKKNFKDEIEIPKSFLLSKADSIDAFSKLTNYILTKTVKDSVLFYSEEAAAKYYTFNNLKYKFYNDIADVRKKMIEILCKNDKASFVLVINPPLSSDNDEEKSKAEAAKIKEEKKKAEEAEIKEEKKKTEEARIKEEKKKTEEARTEESKGKKTEEARISEGKGKKPRKYNGFLGKDRTVDESKSGIYTKKELNGNN